MAEIEVILKQSEKGAAALAKYKGRKNMLESMPNGRPDHG